MLDHEKHQASVALVPGGAFGYGEEGVWARLVVLWHQDLQLHRYWGPSDVLFPHLGQKQRPRGVHDGDVGHEPVDLEPLQLDDGLEEERVLRNGAHDVVRDPSGVCFAHKAVELQERVQISVAPVVQVDVDPTVVGQDKVTDRVCAFDVVRIRVVRLQEPRIVVADEISGHLVRPEDVLVVGMQVYAALLTLLPHLRHRAGLVGLVDDFRNELVLRSWH